MLIAIDTIQTLPRASDGADVAFSGFRLRILNLNYFEALEIDPGKIYVPNDLELSDDNPEPGVHDGFRVRMIRSPVPTDSSPGIRENLVYEFWMFADALSDLVALTAGNEEQNDGTSNP